MKGLQDKIFTHHMIKDLDTDTVERLAGETEELSQRRTALQNEVSCLEQLLKVLKSS